MSTSLLAFLTLLEKRTLPVLPTGRSWRFQRLVDFRAARAVLQLWEEPDGPASAILTGQVDLRETRHEDGAPSFAGAVQSTDGGSEMKNFSFHPRSEADVEHQATVVANLWGKAIGGNPQ